MKLKNLPIRQQLFLVSSTTAVSLIAALCFVLYWNFRDYKLSSSIFEQVRIGKVIAKLIHEVQKERGLANRFLGKPTEETLVELQNQRATADAIWSQLQELLQSQTQEKNQRFQAFRTSWKDLRLLVDQKKETPETAQANFTKLIQGFIAESDLSTASGESIFSDKLRTLYLFLIWKDVSGQLRSNLNVSLIVGKFNSERYFLCMDAINKIDLLVSLMMETNNATKVQEYVSYYENRKFGEVTRFLKMNPETLPPGLSQSEWWIISSERMDHLQRILLEEADNLEALTLADLQKNISILLGILILSVIVVVLSLSIMFWISKRLGSEISHLAEVMKDAEQGVLVTGRAVVGKDEIAKLASSFSALTQFFTELILSLRTNSTQSQAVFEETRELTSSFSKTALSLASGSEEISAASEEVLSQSESVKFSIDASETNVRKIKEDIMRLSKSSSEITQLVGKLKTNAGELQHFSNHGNAMMQELEGQMSAVQSASQEIHAVLKLINDISGSTNLLSLNAAIEAAKAGDSGRGFAVVAENIASLAQNSVSSVKRIEGIIKNLNLSVERSVANIKENRSSLNKINASAQDNLSQINTIAGNVESNLKSSKAIENQILGISDNFVGIKQATQENIGAMRSIQEGITSISQEAEVLSKETSQLQTRMQELEATNKTLVEKISFFH